MDAVSESESQMDLSGFFALAAGGFLAAAGAASDDFLAAGGRRREEGGEPRAVWCGTADWIFWI